MKSLTTFITESTNKLRPANKKELQHLLETLPREHWGKINTKKITDMSELFYGAKLRVSKYNGIDISTWDVSNVKDMSYMFDNADIIDLDISNWDVSNVKNMKGMFQNTTIDDMDISNWDVSNVENMDNMFNGSTFTGDISKWNTAKVKSMKGIFDYSKLEKNPPKWYNK